jgi:4-hydroxy-3-methylbut-2-en-1-yl diphosphate synthase IspG/GcpE
MRAMDTLPIYTIPPKSSVAVDREVLYDAKTLRSRVEVAMIECREHPRIPVELRVLFSTTEQTEIRQGTMFDVSVGGCAVTSTVSMSPGTGVKLLIHATDLAVPITVHSAAVRWVKHGEFGVEFLRLTDLDRSRLQRLLQLARPRSVPQD